MPVSILKPNPIHDATGHVMNRDSASYFLGRLGEPLVKTDLSEVGVAFGDEFAFG